MPLHTNREHACMSDPVCRHTHTLTVPCRRQAGKQGNQPTNKTSSQRGTATRECSATKQGQTVLQAPVSTYQCTTHIGVSIPTADMPLHTTNREHACMPEPVCRHTYAAVPCRKQAVLAKPQVPEQCKPCKSLPKTHQAHAQHPKCETAQEQTQQEDRHYLVTEDGMGGQAWQKQHGDHNQQPRCQAKPQTPA